MGYGQDRSASSQLREAYDRYEFHRVYQACNQFCSVTLSALYHDVLKDRLYTLAEDHSLRRSSQTAIYHIFNALVRVLGPILPFTADEAWSYFLSDQDFVDQPLALQSWPSEAKNWRDENLERDFQELLAFRDLVNEKLEDLRKRGDIGRSLDAYLTISGSSEAQTFKLLRSYEKFLDELFIVSLVEPRKAIPLTFRLTLPKRRVVVAHAAGVGSLNSRTALPTKSSAFVALQPSFNSQKECPKKNLLARKSPQKNQPRKRQRRS